MTTHTHNIMIDDETFSIMTTESWPTNDNEAFSLMTNTMREMIPFLTRDSELIARGHYSDDDTDYMPALANAYATLTSHTVQTDFDPLESLNELMKNYDFIQDMYCLSAQYNINALRIN